METFGYVERPNIWSKYIATPSFKTGFFIWRSLLRVGASQPLNRQLKIWPI